MGKNFPRQLFVLLVHGEFDVGEDVKRGQHTPGIVSQDDGGDAVGLKGGLGDLGLDFGGIGSNSYNRHEIL